MRILLSAIFLLYTQVLQSSCLPELPQVPKCEKNCNLDACCSKMGGIHYCDNSAGRYVCKNGFYSSCYCTRHAIMDLQDVEGCCIWQGGVLAVNPHGLVICNNGGVSELCSLQKPPKKVSSF